MAHMSRYEDGDGYWVFGIRSTGRVKLSANRLVLQHSGKTEEFDKGQLEQVGLEPARFIWLVEPGGEFGFFANTGMHDLWYGDLENAQFFLALLARLWSLPITRKPASRFGR
jgi:hypothetical protein